VKLLLDRSEARRFTLRATLEEVRKLPVEDLPLARPLEVLRPPDCGYVMELLTGMVPISRLSRPEGDDAAAWYSAGGGLRRRLAALANAAEVLNALHARAIAWCDPSPYNIFIAEALDAESVRLIDTDNLRWTSRPGPVVYTEGYAAPELKAERSGVTTLTDAHAFAVITFEVLSLAHPLLGDAVRDAEPDVEQAALRGEWPWVDHPTDDRNRSTIGIPRELLFTRRLREVFARTFEDGLHDAMKRPGLGELAEALREAWAATVVCPACDASYLLGERNCPWCEASRPAMVLTDVGLWAPELEAPLPGEGGHPHRLGVLAVTEGASRTLPAVFGGGGKVAFRLEGNRLWVSGPCTLRSPDGKHRVEVGAEERPLDLVPRRRPWTIHLGPLDRTHRVVTPNLHPAVTP
jgi:DNA-binding helix-hairpin-helix protein with protein kinase domain